MRSLCSVYDRSAFGNEMEPICRSSDAFRRSVAGDTAWKEDRFVRCNEANAKASFLLVLSITSYGFVGAAVGDIP